MTTINVVRIQKSKDSEWEKALELIIGIDNKEGAVYDVFGNIVTNYINIERFKKRKLKKTLDYFP